MIPHGQGGARPQLTVFAVPVPPTRSLAGLPVVLPGPLFLYVNGRPS